jgi:hypothetical protein
MSACAGWWLVRKRWRLAMAARPWWLGRPASRVGQQIRGAGGRRQPTIVDEINRGGGQRRRRAQAGLQGRPLCAGQRTHDAGNLPVRCWTTASSNWSEEARRGSSRDARPGTALPPGVCTDHRAAPTEGRWQHATSLQPGEGRCSTSPTADRSGNVPANNVGSLRATACSLRRPWWVARPILVPAPAPPIPASLRRWLGRGSGQQRAHGQQQVAGRKRFAQIEQPPMRSACASGSGAPVTSRTGTPARYCSRTAGAGRWRRTQATACQPSALVTTGEPSWARASSINSRVAASSSAT